MNSRFVLDESSWAAASGTDTGVLSNAIQRLIERLDVARERNEGVARHAGYYEAAIGDGEQLFSALFEPACRVQLDRDLAERLRLALDRAIEFDDSELDSYDAAFEGRARFAPGVAWAHACCAQRSQVAVLPLPINGVPRGRVSVTVVDTTIDLFFVTEESEHVDFFRSVIALENADERMFEYLARSAFPALAWADGVWRGLGHFSRPYTEGKRSVGR